MFKYDVLCVGSATVDRFLTVNQSLRSIIPGDKILARNLEIHSGGGSTNSAVALAKLGLNVRVLTKLGHDHEGDFIEQELRKYKVKNICRTRAKKNTDSSTIIFSASDKDRIVYNYKGASQELLFHDLPRLYSRAKWFYLASLVGKSFTAISLLAEYAEKKHISILFNPSLYLATKGKKYLHPILRRTELLVLNKKEAQTLLNSQSSHQQFLLRSLHHLGPTTVVITDGPKTIYALHENSFYSVKPPTVKVAHTLGAGDAFTSGLLAGIVKGYSFEKALQLGVANSTSLIQRVGAKNGLLDEREALSMIKRYKMKVSRR
ncbi:carbohydrate kinase family protein [Candidatus Woesearchaeota archaeon]|nr:carbohydrate kinase family protein [Candidatus Woesearchaeota archaeon]